ncbi:uncharacterized protein LOC143891168 [Tasmannia lanceolata]|uniref:uncharacterized protein LOC143891168 n=1 Tax=Tasmannia lanceolata TaxID=3420 RepID=UPI0040638E16
MALRQEHNESLKDFVRRFNKEALQITNLDPSAAVNALLSGAKSDDFKRSIARKAPTSLADLIAKSKKYISVEDTVAALNSKYSGQYEKNGQSSNQKHRREDGPSRKDKSPLRREENFTPLNTSRAKILAAITNEDFLREESQIWRIVAEKRRILKKKSLDLYTSSSDLLIASSVSTNSINSHKKLHQDQFSRNKNTRSGKERTPNSLSGQKKESAKVAVAGKPSQISSPGESSSNRAILRTNWGHYDHSGRPAAGGTSSVARRAYACQVNLVHIPDKKLKADNTISFSDADLNDAILPHNDALVITMLIANFEMPRILVDNGSSADILYYHTFKQLGIKDDLLKPSSTKLYGFEGEVVRVVGSIELPVLIGSAPLRATAMVDFLEVNTPSMYNTILGRPG